MDKEHDREEEKEIGRADEEVIGAEGLGEGGELDH